MWFKKKFKFKKIKKDLKRISKERDTCGEELKALKEKREDTVIVDIEETAKMKKENEELQSELKNWLTDFESIEEKLENKIQKIEDNCTALYM